jgi:hypothetical protein
MRPVDLQPIGNELAIKWEDGTESYIGLEKAATVLSVRGLQGEMDIMGNLYKGPERALTSKAFELQRLVMVGTYAVSNVGRWHSTDFIRLITWNRS